MLAELKGDMPDYSIKMRQACRDGTDAYRAALLAADALPINKGGNNARRAAKALVEAKKSLASLESKLRREYYRLKTETMLERSRLVCIRHEINLSVQNVIRPTNAPERIITETASRHGLSTEIIKSRKRTFPITRARQEAFYLLRVHTNLSMVEMGKLFSGIDHSTVSAGIKSHVRRMKEAAA